MRKDKQKDVSYRCQFHKSVLPVSHDSSIKKLTHYIVICCCCCRFFSISFSSKIVQSKNSFKSSHLVFVGWLPIVISCCLFACYIFFFSSCAADSICWSIKWMCKVVSNGCDFRMVLIKSIIIFVRIYAASKNSNDSLKSAVITFDIMWWPIIVIDF